MGLVYDTFTDEFSILGYKMVYKRGLTYKPGKDSEELCKKVLSEVGGTDAVLDLGCGTGALGLIIKKNKPNTFVMAVDIDQDAIENTIINQNSIRKNLDSIVLSDMFNSVPQKPFDAIVGALPYMSEDTYESLPDYKKSECVPKRAFVAGETSLYCFGQIASHLKWLSNNGKLYLTVPDLWADEITSLYINSGLKELSSEKLDNMDCYIKTYGR